MGRDEIRMMAAAETGGTAFHGLERPFKSVDGARAVRVSHAGGQIISPHRHDWACITISLVGQAIEYWDGGEAQIAGPAVLLHPPGSCHADDIGGGGLETVSILFDAKWLPAGMAFKLERPGAWFGGRACLEARQLARNWSQHRTDADIAGLTAGFLQRTLATKPAPPPPWLRHVRDALVCPQRESTAALAARLGLHPAWLARAYRLAAGEGVQETVRRRRVEHALPLVRRTGLPLADVAAAAGFCDQSHMTRDFRALIGRTPRQVRTEDGSAGPPGVC